VAVLVLIPTEEKTIVMRSKWFRLVAVLLALVLVAGACGRGDDDDDASGDDDDTTATTAGDEDGGDEGGGEPEAVPGFDGETIKLGILTPLTDRVAIIGLPLTAGNETWFDHVNDEGGIAGKYKIEVDVQDTKYDGPTAVQLYSGMKEDVVMIAQALGTGVVDAILPQLEQDGLVAQPATLDSFWIGEQQLLPVGTPYQIQAINGISYFIDNGGEGKNICGMAQDDPFGDAGMQGVDFAAEELGFDVKARPTFKVTDTDFTAQINELQSNDCAAVFCVCTAANVSGIMGAAEQAGFEPQWIGQSPIWLPPFAGNAYMQEHLWVASDGPLLEAGAGEAVAEMLELKEKYNPDASLDQYFYFGYVAAQHVTQVLEKAVEMGDLSHEGIVEAMNSITAFDLPEELGSAYEAWGPPEDRKPPRTTTIFAIDPAGPGGFKVVEAGIVSDAAKKFEFETE
jgi:ABC-type branched-subunit amino acid transport system substrate-binding protein